MNVAIQRPMTLQEFLCWEEQQEQRYEFDGYAPEAMAGGTATHDQIATNLAASLVTRLRGKPCRARGSNLKVEVMGSIRYPDGYVTCTPVVGTSTVAKDPVVIFEVLSKATAGKNRITKNREYRGTGSVTHYVMLETSQIFATVLERQGDQWVSTLAGPGDTLRFSSIDIEIPLDELYEYVDFADSAGEEG